MITATLVLLGLLMVIGVAFESEVFALGCLAAIFGIAQMT